MADMCFGGNWAGSTGDSSAYEGMQTDDGTISGSVGDKNLMGGTGKRDDDLQDSNPNALVGVIATIIGFLVGGPVGAAIGLLGMDKDGDLTVGSSLLGNYDITGKDGYTRGYLGSDNPISDMSKDINDLFGQAGNIRGTAQYPDIDLTDPRYSNYPTPLDSRGKIDYTDLSLEDQLYADIMESTKQEGAPNEFISNYQNLLGTPTIADPYSAEDRLTQINDIIARIQGETAIPEGLSEEEFNSIITQQMLNRDIGLGADATQQQVTDAFAGSNLGDLILQDELFNRQNTFNTQIGDVFTGDAFKSLDDNIINSILDERQGTASQTLANYGARGNLNKSGGQTASRILGEQRDKGFERLSEIGEGVLGGRRQDVSDIRDRATTAASDYKLGDELFDIQPYVQERQDVIKQGEGSLGSDISGALGGEPLFDVGSALSEAGRSQGVVSGPGASLLDTIAERQTGSGRYRERGLGTKGSGAF